MYQTRTSLILGSSLDYHRRLDERKPDGKSSAVSQRTDIENPQGYQEPALAQARNEPWADTAARKPQVGSAEEQRKQGDDDYNVHCQSPPSVPLASILLAARTAVQLR